MAAAILLPIRGLVKKINHLASSERLPRWSA